MRLSRWTGVASALVIGLIAVGCARDLAGASGSLEPSTSASFSPAPVATPTLPVATPSPPTPTTPPINDDDWSSLAIRQLASAPIEISRVIPWAHGYVAFGASVVDGPVEVWTSTDGRAWSALPDSALGLGGARHNSAYGGAMCGQSVLVATRDDNQLDLIWRSTDGSAWSQQPAPAGLRADLEYGTLVVAGNERGAVAVAQYGQSAASTSDCTTWQTSRLPGPGKFSLAAAAASEVGFAIVGYAVDGLDGILGPLAWRSTDGVAWSTSSTPDDPGIGLVSVTAASRGFVASGAEIGVAPGVGSFWVSPDGRAWTQSTANPLGLATSGAGIGSPVDSFSGDGVRLVSFGRRGADVPAEYWVSLNGTSWSQLTLTGTDSAALLADPLVHAFPMRDGILFNGGYAMDAVTWFGAAVTR